MNYCYFGLIDKIMKKIVEPVFKWVFNKILSPIVDWLGGLFKELFSFIYKTFLQPILEKAIMAVLKWAWEMIATFFGELLFEVEVLILKVVDRLANIFQVFIGAQNIYNADTRRTENMFQALFNTSGVKNVFWTFSIIGFMLILLFAVLGILKTTFNAESDGRGQSISKLVRDILKAMFTIFSGPLLAALLVAFSITFAKSTTSIVTFNMSSNNSGKITFGSAIFAISTLPWETSTSISDLTRGARGRFLYNESDWTNSSEVKRVFKYKDINFILGIFAGLIILIAIAKVSYALVKRLFDVILLYITLPFFAASIPVDGGEKYKRWKDMFISRIFISNGTFLLMVMTELVFIPWVITLDINTGDGIINLLFKLVLLISAATNLDAFPRLAEGLFTYEAASIDSEATSHGLRQIGQPIGDVVGLAKSVKGVVDKIGKGIGMKGGGGADEDGGDGGGDGDGGYDGFGGSDDGFDGFGGGDGGDGGGDGGFGVNNTFTGQQYAPAMSSFGVQGNNYPMAPQYGPGNSNFGVQNNGTTNGRNMSGSSGGGPNPGNPGQASRSPFSSGSGIPQISNQGTTNMGNAGMGGTQGGYSGDQGGNGGDQGGNGGGMGGDVMNINQPYDDSFVAPPPTYDSDIM